MTKGETGPNTSLIPPLLIKNESPAIDRRKQDGKLNPKYDITLLQNPQCLFIHDSFLLTWEIITKTRDDSGIYEQWPYKLSPHKYAHLPISREILTVMNVHVHTNIFRVYKIPLDNKAVYFTSTSFLNASGMGVLGQLQLRNTGRGRADLSWTKLPFLDFRVSENPGFLASLLGTLHMAGTAIQVCSGFQAKE